MKLKEFIKAMSEIENGRKLTKEVVVAALEEALAKAYRKHIEIPDALVRVDINEKSGEIKVYHQRLVVEEVEDDELEISLADARAIKDSFELEDLVEEEVDFRQFGRVAVILAKNVMKQKIREAEKLAIYDEYIDQLDEMVFGQVETVEEKFALVNIGSTIALMPRVAQIPNEVYREGQTIRVVISEVNKETKGAQVLVSRADTNLVKRLFEKEVPEIFDGTIEIKAIAREAGERTKMAVVSHNHNVDPIGACIGPRGARVQVIIDELHGEKIDIFKWSEDTTELIKNALAPAEVISVIDNSNERRSNLLVVVADNQLSLAIGKKGKNARLAVKLTGKKIDIKSVSDVVKMGIDYEAIAQQQAEEKANQAALEAEKARYLEEVLVDELVDEAVNEVVAEEVETIVEEAVEAVEVETERKLDEYELAAKLAKEKAKEKDSHARRDEYVSKFEAIADHVKPEEVKAKPKRRFTKDEEAAPVKRKATHDLTDKEYALKPIYTAEELAEIERAQQEEEAKAWSDDFDFEDYDEYYEAE